MGWCGGETGSRRKERKRGTLREVLCCDGLGRLEIEIKSFTRLQSYFIFVGSVDVYGNHDLGIHCNACFVNIGFAIEAQKKEFVCWCCSSLGSFEVICLADI